MLIGTALLSAIICRTAGRFESAVIFAVTRSIPFLRMLSERSTLRLICFPCLFPLIAVLSTLANTSATLFGQLINCWFGRLAGVTGCISAEQLWRFEHELDIPSRNRGLLHNFGHGQIK